jgi:xylan 1,4-beta-xylosidase
VLTWAFTFPDSPYFAGYRALETNGIHLPVLNAFKLLGSLRGARLPVASSGARSLSDILDNGVRQEPDVDALATIDGDRIQVLVWHYHDDLVDGPSVPVTLEVAVPPAFGASSSSRALGVTHRRVDETHGDAFTIWVSQGSPATPSAPELAALREAMEPVLLSPTDGVLVADGAVRLSFDLPRFGISLLEIAPLNGSDPEAPPPSPAGCSCRVGAPSRSLLPALLALSLVGALIHRRRYAPSVRRGI